MTDDELIALARAVRFGLPDDSAAAATLDELIARAEAGEAVAGELVLALAADAHALPALRELVVREPDPERGSPAGYAGLVGFGDPSGELHYDCDVCDYTFPVFEAGEPVPDCPYGHGSLRPRGGPR